MIYRFYKEAARLFGLPEAALLYHIAYWVKVNRREHRNRRDGRYWWYESVRSMAEDRHDYLTERQIRRALNHLSDEGMLLTANYNRTTYDRTTWYTLTDKAEAMLHDWEMEEPYQQDGSD